TLGFVTALGGGTLRDVMIGSTPVGWMQNETYIFIVMSALPICYIAKDIILRMKKGVFLFDTIGIGLFTILGLKKTLAMGLSPLIAVMMGVVSAVFGGVIRDVLANRAPLIFSKEIYAIACLSGAVLFLIAEPFCSEPIATASSILMVIIIRILAIKRHWGVPFNP
ncbi:MAG: putative membrane protein YeiH, partial [Nonlabens sp.]